MSFMKQIYQAPKIFKNIGTQKQICDKIRDMDLIMRQKVHVMYAFAMPLVCRDEEERFQKINHR
jgi:hypothetical protein